MRSSDSAMTATPSLGWAMSGPASARTGACRSRPNPFARSDSTWWSRPLDCNRSSSTTGNRYRFASDRARRTAESRKSLRSSVVAARGIRRQTSSAPIRGNEPTCRLRSTASKAITVCARRHRNTAFLGPENVTMVRLRSKSVMKSRSSTLGVRSHALASRAAMRRSRPRDHSDLQTSSIYMPTMLNPLSTNRICPVTPRLRSLRRYTAEPATSSCAKGRLRGAFCST